MHYNTTTARSGIVHVAIDSRRTQWCHWYLLFTVCLDDCQWHTKKNGWVSRNCFKIFALVVGGERKIGHECASHRGSFIKTVIKTVWKQLVSPWNACREKMSSQLIKRRTWSSIERITIIKDEWIAIQEAVEEESEKRSSDEEINIIINVVININSSNIATKTKTIEIEWQRQRWDEMSNNSNNNNHNHHHHHNRSVN